jgi:Putative zinc-finger
MTCNQAKSLFSPYLDGAITGMQMRTLTVHLDSCAACQREYSLLRGTQLLLAKVGRRRPPEDLALKLRLAISHEVAKSKQPLLGAASVRFQNALRAFMVPATAGLIAAVTTFVLLLGSMALPLEANNSDVPLMKTAPEFKESQFGMSLDSIHEDSLVIEAYVDARGRVDDYKILSNPKSSKELLPEVNKMLIFTTFRPATYMGMPTSGRAVLSFSKISVRG